MKEEAGEIRGSNASEGETTLVKNKVVKETIE